MKRILIALLILTMAFAAVAAPGPRPGAGRGNAAPGGPQHRGAGPSGLLSPEALAEFLDLSEAQIAQIQTLRETQRATIEPLLEQQRANHEAVEAALAAGNASAAGTAMLANYNLRAQIKAAHDSFNTAFEALLTSEQQAKWSVYQEIVELTRRRPRD